MEILISRDLIFEGAVFRVDDTQPTGKNYSGRELIIEKIKDDKIFTRDILTSYKSYTNFDTFQRLALIPQTLPTNKKIIKCPLCGCFSAVYSCFWGHHLWAIQGKCAGCGASFNINKEEPDIIGASYYSKTKRDAIFKKYQNKIFKRLKDEQKRNAKIFD